MVYDEIIKDFESLIKHLEFAVSNVNKDPQTIKSELKKWSKEITIEEINESLKSILKKVKKWHLNYKRTGDILTIDLKEYDWVSKESSYIMGECVLVDELHMEVIHYLIMQIGRDMVREIKEGGKSDG